MGSAGNILVGVLAEDVPNDHNSLLDHVVDLGLDQVQQGADTALSWLLERNGTEAPCHYYLWKKVTITHNTTYHSSLFAVVWSFDTYRGICLTPDGSEVEEWVLINKTTKQIKSEPTVYNIKLELKLWKLFEIRCSNCWWSAVKMS